MKHIALKVAAAIITFMLGVGCVYVGWLASRSYDIPPLNNYAFEVDPDLALAAERLALQQPQRSLEEEWKELTTTSLCTGGVYYDPERDSETERGAFSELPLFNPYSLMPSLKRDRHAAIYFLLEQIPDRAPTHAHVCPQATMTKGEMAIYCLQHMLKVNWYDLKEQYAVRYHYMYKTDVMESQYLLKGILGSRSGAREMQKLWTEYYRSHASSIPGGPSE
ncbi:MAG TPA: hypothetical protein VIW80_12640 [Pyrinomonadaceae bacterium]|jgi:hypothetical protein